MRHRKKGRKLNRNIKQRQALFKGLIVSLIFNQEIKTTQAKAKAIKPIIDKLITKAKTSSLANRRQVLAFLSDKKAVNHLFDIIAPQVKKRTSGFTRFIRLGNRRGDNTMMVRMELVDKKEVKEEVQSVKTDSKSKKSAKKQTASKAEKIAKPVKQATKKGFFAQKLKQIIPQKRMP